MFVSVSFALVFLALACNDKDAGEKDSDPVDTGAAPTYHQDIAPILSVRCASCHTPGGMNQDLLFDNVEDATQLAPLIAGVLSTGQMPPFYAKESEECPNPWGWLHDPRLPDDEMSLIMAWADAGAPEGDASTAVELPPPPTKNLTGVDLTLMPTGKWTTEPFGAVQDQFVCFSLDPGIDETKWLEALQVVPENNAVVHHVLVGIDHEGQSASIVDANGLYDCFGGFGVDASFIGGWIPGSSPLEFPERSAFRVGKDARIVLQMHYHLVDSAEEDGTGVSLRWAEKIPVREAYVGLIGNAGTQESDGSGLQPGPNDEGGVEFRVPAGVSDHTETMWFNALEYDAEFQVFLVANHMHYIGTDMRFWIERGPNAPDNESTCLLHTPEWDFDWQQFYWFDANNNNAPVVYENDQAWIECTYDNTLDNPGVQQALSEGGLTSPIDIELGDGSLSEMCIAVLGLVPVTEWDVDGATHTGELNLGASSTSFGFDTTCSGPFNAKVGADGSLEAKGACGIDITTLLATMELALSGTVAADGTATGTVDISVVAVPGSASASWTGNISGDTLTVDLSTTVTISGGDVTLDGTLVATAE